MSRIRKVILINSLKGGVGKTSVAFCLIKYLASLKKQVKVFDFDGLNHGLSAILKTYLPKKLTPFVTTDDKGSIEFFRRSMKYVADVYNDFDYILLDGHIFPCEFARVEKMVPNLICAIYVVPDDYTINEKDLREVVRRYTDGVRQRLVFLFNLKNNDSVRLLKFKGIVEDEIVKTCKKCSIDPLRRPIIAPRPIAYYPDISKLFEQYIEVSETLLLDMLKHNLI